MALELHKFLDATLEGNGGGKDRSFLVAIRSMVGAYIRKGENPDSPRMDLSRVPYDVETKDRLVTCEFIKGWKTTTTLRNLLCRVVTRRETGCDLEINSIRDLYDSFDDGSIRSIRGIGVKSIESIQENLEFVLQNGIMPRDRN